MTIFKTGNFTFHSGQKATFKVDLDDLTDEDWAALAAQVGKNCWHKFGRVFGVERGGIRFADALGRYCTESENILIVDDVFTTGASMEEKRAELKELYPDSWSFGIVVFTRTHEMPAWVYPIFEVKGWFISV